MTEYIREICVLEIMSDDQIQQSIKEELQKMESPIGSMVLTWEKTRTEYFLEIIMRGDAKVVCRCSEAGDTADYHLVVGKISAYEYDAVNKLFVAGRRLFFRLKKDFPMLRCKLSTYKYLRT